MNSVSQVVNNTTCRRVGTSGHTDYFSAIIEDFDVPGSRTGKNGCTQYLKEERKEIVPRVIAI